MFKVDDDWEQRLSSRPKWKPEKPTWCNVWDNVKSRSTLALIVRYEECAHGFNYVAFDESAWSNAEPCATEDIPEWWPEEWT